MKSDDHLLKGKTETLPYFVSYSLGELRHDGTLVMHEERIDAVGEVAAKRTLREKFPTASKIQVHRGVVVVCWRPADSKAKWIECNKTDCMSSIKPLNFQEDVQELRNQIAYCTQAPHYTMLLPGGVEAYRQNQTSEFTCRVYNSSLAVPEEI